MNRPTDTLFAGSVPDVYERLMVPLYFEAFAQDLARRAVAVQPTRVLELAAGTGVVTRALARSLPAEVPIVATDLNPPMIDKAQSIGTSRPVAWQPANAMALPFPDESFDLVVCQFGFMFFPDKAKAHAEARRVLRRGGTWLFNVWDSLACNDDHRVVHETLVRHFPQPPLDFFARMPFGYHDRHRILYDLREGGFDPAAATFETVAARSHAESAEVAASALCHGTPARGEIEAREPAGLVRVTRECAQALREAFGGGPLDGRMQAHVITARK
jgi:ubiquinone/menaquinone biosynthesis C-methylase UbiE